MGRSPVVSVMLGRADEMRAEVYVRVPEAAWGPRQRTVRLSGTLTGPRCRRVTTLPSKTRLSDLGPALDGDRSAAARAIVTEPSYWTPDLPNLYRLDVQVSDGEGPIGSFERSIGLRRLGVRGRSFWLDGRRWVPRGAVRDAAGFDGPALHEAGVAAVVVDPTTDVREQADRDGVAVVAVLGDGTDSPPAVEMTIDSIAAWSLHPSVVMAVLPPRWPLDRTADIAARSRSIKGTMLLAMEVDGGRPPEDARPQGVDCLIVRLERDQLPHPLWRGDPPPLPLVAWRADGPPAGGDRRSCDRLQADLAAWATADGSGQPVVDWAGYVVE
jgi:hypothetical protein